MNGLRSDTISDDRTIEVTRFEKAVVRENREFIQQVSISSTFYVQIFRTNVIFLVTFGFVEKFVQKYARV